jgi:hypothetical protein
VEIELIWFNLQTREAVKTYEKVSSLETPWNEDRKAGRFSVALRPKIAF